MSIKWHPDKYKGDPEEAVNMQTSLNEAREVLTRKKKGGGRDVEAEVREERAEARAAREAGAYIRPLFSST
jgi:curved DNA-binding protein CbpA